MSALIVVGFFNLCGGQRTSSVKPNSTTNTWHCVYHTSVQCESGDLLPAQIRVYSPVNDVPLAEGTVAFTLARVSVQPREVVVLDAILLIPVPGDPGDDSYQLNVPELLYPIFFALGSVVGKPELQVDGSKKFSVACSEFVQNERRNSTVCCVFGIGPRWAHTPLPTLNSTVFVVGTAYQVAEDGILALNALHVALNVGAAPIPAPPGAPGNGPGGNKRQRFAGWPAIAGSSQVSSSSGTASTGVANTLATPVASGSGLRRNHTSTAQHQQGSARHESPLTPLREDSLHEDESELALQVVTDGTQGDEENELPSRRSAKAKGKRPARK